MEPNPIYRNLFTSERANAVQHFPVAPLELRIAIFSLLSLPNLSAICTTSVGILHNTVAVITSLCRRPTGLITNGLEATAELDQFWIAAERFHSAISLRMFRLRFPSYLTAIQHLTMSLPPMNRRAVESIDFPDLGNEEDTLLRLQVSSDNDMLEERDEIFANFVEPDRSEELSEYVKQSATLRFHHQKLSDSNDVLPVMACALQIVDDDLRARTLQHLVAEVLKADLIEQAIDAAKQIPETNFECRKRKINTARKIGAELGADEPRSRLMKVAGILSHETCRNICLQKIINDLLDGSRVQTAIELARMMTAREQSGQRRRHTVLLAIFRHLDSTLSMDTVRRAAQICPNSSERKAHLIALIQTHSCIDFSFELALHVSMEWESLYMPRELVLELVREGEVNRAIQLADSISIPLMRRQALERIQMAREEIEDESESGDQSGS